MAKLVEGDGTTFRSQLLVQDPQTSVGSYSLIDTYLHTVYSLSPIFYVYLALHKLTLRAEERRSIGRITKCPDGIMNRVEKLRSIS